MQRHSHGSRYTVYDAALPPDQLDLLRTEGARRTVKPTLSSINRFHDGISFQGSGPSGTFEASDQGPDGSIVATLAAQCLSVAGGEASNPSVWSYSSTYTTYTAGTQLSWHDDGADRVGAFIYYLGDWSGEWGGELDIIDCEPELIPRRTSLADGIVDAPINVTCIFPRPNRLVVLTARTLHRVRRIDPLAGSHVRQASSGFVAATN